MTWPGAVRFRLFICKTWILFFRETNHMHGTVSPYLLHAISGKGIPCHPCESCSCRQGHPGRGVLQGLEVDSGELNLVWIRLNMFYLLVPRLTYANYPWLPDPFLLYPRPCSVDEDSMSMTTCSQHARRWVDNSRASLSMYKDLTSSLSKFRRIFLYIIFESILSVEWVWWSITVDMAHECWIYLYPYIHTYMHAYNTNTHICTQANLHAYAHTCTWTHTCTYTYACAYTYTIKTYSHIYMHMHIHVNVHIRVHIKCVHMYLAHTHKHDTCICIHI